MPSTRCRVVCGFFEVMLIRAPTSALSSVDLPTLGRPTIATWPQRNARPEAASPDTRFDRRSAAGRLLIGDSGSGLFGGAPAGAGTDRFDTEGRDAAYDFERLQVRLPFHVHDRVFGHR